MQLGRAAWEQMHPGESAARGECSLEKQYSTGRKSGDPMLTLTLRGKSPLFPRYACVINPGFYPAFNPAYTPDAWQMPCL